MADKAPKSENGYDVLGQVTGFIIIVFILGTILAGYGIGSGKVNLLGQPDEQENASGDEVVNTRSSGFSDFIFSGKVSLGDSVIARDSVTVHRNPAGRIVGEQDKREVGKVLEGPVNAQNMNWWRIDFKQAPDGWVDDSDITSRIWLYRILNIFPIFFETMIPFFILLALIFFVLIIVVLYKMKNLDKFKQKKLDYARGKNIKEEIEETVEEEKKEDEKVGEKDSKENLISILPTDSSAPKTKDVHNRRWAKVESLINSHNVNDWKQAIIEADIILDEMLEKMGYKGDTMAEKLKQVEESDFLTLNQAWEAHKIRNKIAHKAEYVLTKGDADRAINLFKEVFEEFYFI
ncbi:hypothetical protein GW764_01785 [Candidatus Parcubacteria bacterium]|nr:hypothetical protein [Candidatus Parcubacteria bacterium]